MAMNVLFEDEALEELYLTGKSSDKKYKKLSRDKKLVDGFIRAVGVMYGVDNVDELENYSYLHYEKLKYRDESSVRIVNGRVERLIFAERDNGIEVLLIEIDDTHYGNKG